MNTKLAVGIAVVLAAGGGWYAYTNQQALVPATSDLGSYPYACDNGSEFTMTPAEDVSSVTLTPGTGATFARATLAQKNASGSARYEGTGMSFTGAGEEISLTVGSTLLICRPKPNPDMAPWNWGDAGEGGGVKQDVSVIVSESIVGAWKSVDDAKFVREFKSGGAVVDSYGAEVKSSGTWNVFTAGKPLSVSFPLQPNTVYVQLTMAGTQADNLNFKVSKLTPDELDLTYMDRGGVLRFTKAQ